MLRVLCVGSSLSRACRVGSFLALFFADVYILSPGFVLSSLGDVAVIRFVNLLSCLPGNVLLNLYIYAQPCIELAVDYFGEAKRL